MISDNVRKEITIALRQDGEGVAARAALEVEKLKETIERAGREFTNNAIQADEYRKAVRGASTDLGFWVRAQEQATKAMREIDEGFVEMQKHLQMYNERDARDAAENAILKNRIHDSTLAAMRQRADEESAIRNRLREMNERDAAQAVAAEQARVAALKEGTQAVVEHANAIREQSVADRERITVLNKLIPLVKLTADEVAKDQQKQVAAIADSIGSWTAWANVVSHAKDESVRFSERSAETAAAVKAANTALRDSTITAAEANEDIRKITNSQRVLAAAWGEYVLEVDNAAEHTKRNANVVKALAANYDAAGVSLDKVKASAVNLGVAFNEANRPVELGGKIAHEAAATYYEEASAIRTASREIDGFATFLEQAAEHERTATRATLVHANATRELWQEISKANVQGKAYVVQAGQGKEATSEFSYKLLHISHAFQDLQYGFGAVLNNIPLVVQAFGGGPGLGGAIMILGTAISIASNNIGDIGVKLGLTADKAKGAGLTVDTLREKAEALAKKPWKFAVDFADLDEAQRKLEKLEKDKSSFESGRVTSKDRFFADIAERATDAAGGSERVAKGISEYYGKKGVSLGVDAADEIKANNLRKVVAGITEREAKGTDAVTSALNQSMLAKFQSELDTLEHKMQKDRADAANAMAGRFRSGDAQTAAIVQAMQREMPGLFGGDKARDAIRTVPASDRDRADIYKSFAESKKAEIDYDDQREKSRLKVQNEEKERRVYEELKRSSESAAEQRINEKASRFGGDFEKANKRRILEGIASGKGNDAIAGEMTAGAVSSLGEAGVPKSIVNEVAKRILTKAIENVAGDTAAASLGGKGGIKAAAKDMIGGIDEKESSKEEAEINREKAGLKRDARDAKEAKRQALINTLQNEFGATQGQAEEAAPKIEEMLRRLPKGASPGFAYQAVFAKMAEYMNRQNMLMLEQQAAAEAMLGIMGQATQELATRRAVQGGINQRLRRLGGGVRPGLMPTFGFQG